MEKLEGKIEEMIMARKSEIKDRLTLQFEAALERVEMDAIAAVCQGGACADGSKLMSIKEMFPEYDIRPEITKEINRLLTK